MNTMKIRFSKVPSKFGYLLAITALLLLFRFASHAQPSERINVSGIVTDSKNEVLPGVFVVEKNSANGTATDSEGKYLLSVSPDAVLQFSFLGFRT